MQQQLIFDRYNVAAKLKSSGFSETQTDGLINALDGALRDAVATRQDLMSAEARLGSEIKDAEARLGNEIKDIRSEIKDVRSEIKDVRSEIKDVEVRLGADIKDVRSEIKDVEGRLQMEIIKSEGRLHTELTKRHSELRDEMKDLRSELKLDIARLDTAIATSTVTTIKWLVASQVGMAGLLLAAMKYLIK
jgi:chromosome segregation ATPase